MGTSESETKLIFFIRKIPARWVAKLPWVVVVTQCLVIVLLLLDPVRYSACVPVMKQTCTCHGTEAVIQRSVEQSPQNVEETSEALLEQTGDVSIQAKQGGFLLHGPLLTVFVPSHPPRIFFNRVPKCGSSTVMDLITEMVLVHNFTFGRAKEYMRFYLEDQWMERFVQRIQLHPTPLIYERHIHYFDTTKFDMAQPVFINIIRDPLDRLVSWYYFRRYQDGHVRDLPTEQRVRTFDECVLGNHSECMEHGGFHPEEGYFKIIPFFCGQEEYCREPSDRALTQAIHNVKQHYLVVGLLEDFGGFVEALDFLLPDYFKGATRVYTRLEAEWHGRHKTTYKLPVSPEAKRVMQARLIREYQFYIFVQKRFQRLITAIRALKYRTPS